MTRGMMVQIELMTVVNGLLKQVLNCSSCLGIRAGNNYTYSFEVDQTGTYWYHSHVSVEYFDGLLGAIVLLPPKGADPVMQKFNYEGDEVVFVSDW